MQQRGFLMLEACFTTLLLTVIMTLAGMYIVGAHMVFTAKNLTTATCLAEKQLACIKGNAGLWQQCGTIAWQDDRDVLPLNKNAMTFTVVTSIQNSSVDVAVKLVKVAVTWQEYGRDKKIEVVTLVADHV